MAGGGMSIQIQWYISIFSKLHNLLLQSRYYLHIGSRLQPKLHERGPVHLLVELPMGIQYGAISIRNFEYLLSL